MAHRPYTGYLLAAIGASVLVFQIVVYFYGLLEHVDYLIYRPVSYLAMMIGFVGFYMINPKEAIGGASFIRETAIAVISVVRTGKRAGDAVNVEVTPVHDGVAAPTEKQTITLPNPAADDATHAAILASEAAARREKHTLSPPIIGKEG